MGDYVSCEGLQCPICGGSAFVMHDIADGFEFGWSVGCARARIGDKYHNLYDYDSFRKAKIVLLGLSSKEQAIEVWKKRCSNEKVDS